ncbi:glutamine synthetase, catalytic domain protein [Ehrlichia chaffeensis str. Heartland]|uniref:Glutamine synthetase domain protein n=1 Tax=Ehrlichia chaffeensis (strain ATCC CRL-10679 / Arkansas) TaxID=205920 RepID=Q2GFL3_EHRCR|nr:glutamine synthetase [Ehrlichia chaffeensis]ABD44737.1 glutamine synthetase domain protein [Ehrlichia chaffeensis str. Arkansas]AHX04001.1 glutamine synthetase, catalytic domain protein [Ehrlichia chaffeensis str. Heartland]AHX06254.1 glutamine synthetase, catalytic domain protein [Ehrlichia chaffeensis str. Liberty]AHX10895.1 glutamine synthetase, catalytic domain protein [Ehrlichia chaffeensis str. West Paces]
MLNYTLDYLSTKLNIIPLIGIELEFYFDNIDPNNISPLISNIQDKISSLNCNITKEQDNLQYEIQTSTTTNIPNFIIELDLIKEILENNTKHFGGSINFSAKPYLDKPGSAFHIHINLLDFHNNNLFTSQNNKMSDHLSYSIGGLCSLMKKHMIFFAPNNNSYLRYIYADIDTPTTISWGGNNRSTSIRIPSTSTDPTKCRIEHRVPGADCNYKQAITSVLQGIIYGIEKKIQPPQKIYGISSDIQYNLEKLPLSLNESIKYNLK